MLDAGVIALTAFISPYRTDRQKVQELVDKGDFIEIYCRAPLDVCESRDIKGLYKRAKAGEIKEFTGISAPYEKPLDPELIIDTGSLSIEECVKQIINYLAEHGIVTSKHIRDDNTELTR